MPGTRKRIAHVFYAFYSTDARVKNYVDVLRRADWQVDVFALKEKKTIPVDSDVTLHQLTSKYQGQNTLPYVFSYAKFALAAFLSLAFFCFKHRYRVIHVHNMPNFIVYSALIPRLLGARVILDFHDTMPELYLAKFGFTEKHVLYKALVWEERASACFANIVIATNVLHERIFRKHGIPESKIRVIMNLANPTFFRRQGKGRDSERRGFHFIYHGTLTYRLGLDIALRAFSRATSTNPNLSFTIIGDGDVLTDLLSLSHSLGIGQRISFSRCFLPVEELMPHIQQAHAGVVSNRSDAATDFMLPVKLLEYIYMGIPCIAARTKAILHYFNESMVMMFTPGDVDDLARCMVRISTDSSLAGSLVSCAEIFNREHNWELERKRYLDILHELEGKQ